MPIQRAAATQPLELIEGRLGFGIRHDRWTPVEGAATETDQVGLARQLELVGQVLARIDQVGRPLRPLTSHPEHPVVDLVHLAREGDHLVPEDLAPLGDDSIGVHRVLDEQVMRTVVGIVDQLRQRLTQPDEPRASALDLVELGLGVLPATLRQQSLGKLELDGRRTDRLRTILVRHPARNFDPLLDQTARCVRHPIDGRRNRFHPAVGDRLRNDAERVVVLLVRRERARLLGDERMQIAPGVGVRFAEVAVAVELVLHGLIVPQPGVLHVSHLEQSFLRLVVVGRGLRRKVEVPPALLAARDLDDDGHEADHHHDQEAGLPDLLDLQVARAHAQERSQEAQEAARLAPRPAVLGRQLVAVHAADAVDHCLACTLVRGLCRDPLTAHGIDVGVRRAIEVLEVGCDLRVVVAQGTLGIRRHLPLAAESRRRADASGGSESCGLVRSSLRTTCDLCRETRSMRLLRLHEQLARSLSLTDVCGDVSLRCHGGRDSTIVDV